MRHRSKAQGFSLIELLLVLAIIGIISGIAIPSYMGQRRRARVIGDAISNARILSMMMEQVKADNGTYGAAASTATWTYGATYNTPTLTGFAANPCPAFAPAGNSQMNFVLTVGGVLDLTTGAVAAGGTGLTYTIQVSDHTDATGTVIVATDQAGGVWRHKGY